MDPASFLHLMEGSCPELGAIMDNGFPVTRSQEESPQASVRRPSGLGMGYFMPQLAPTPSQPLPPLPPSFDLWALSTSYNAALSPAPATGWAHGSTPKPCAITPARDELWHPPTRRPVRSSLASPSTIGPMAYPLVYPSWTTPHTTTLSEGDNPMSYCPPSLPSTGPPQPRGSSGAYFAPRPVEDLGDGTPAQCGCSYRNESIKLNHKASLPCPDSTEPTCSGFPSCPTFPFSSGHIYSEIPPHTSAPRGNPITPNYHPRLSHVTVLPNPGGCSEIPSCPTCPLISRPNSATTPPPIPAPNKRPCPETISAPTADLTLLNKPHPTMASPLPTSQKETILPPSPPHPSIPLLPLQEMIVPTQSANITYRCYLCRTNFPAFLVLLQHDCPLGPVVGALFDGFPCPICPKEFDSFCDNLQHVTVNHYQPQRTEPFSCPLCQARFTETKGAKKHLQRVHLIPDLRCPICQHCAPNPTQFATHMASHKPSLAGECHKCKREFKYPQARRKHMQKCRAGRKSPRSLIK